jgi:hypothetical protein
VHGGRKMIFLWVMDGGWKKFEITDTAELEKRKISIGDRASIELSVNRRM